MKKFTLFIVMFFSVYMNAQETKTLQNSLVKAKQEHKKVLLYFSGSDWCAPCIKFKKTFIQNEAFQSFASENLIVVNADFPRLKKNALSAEQTTENEKLADKYNANGIFPLVLVLDENGKILKKWEKLPEETIDTFLAQLK
ncbi:MAG: thioredoxin family protein [Flavobacterium sp.]|jgi:thioredoxin-related protein|uniref:thioredoxin family protein n=1 Tax=Flavobacterium TaxID=237 RepID=UPI0022C1E445|nr:thioredoxin family protein [Flavobacterium sp.]MCZ8088978.1 thioredoxin family protein [Flavobacterium sp.]MCZ8330361.1 thioredoxin family protein [Flavobacterium sp.]